MCIKVYWICCCKCKIKNIKKKQFNIPYTNRQEPIFFRKVVRMVDMLNQIISSCNELISIWLQFQKLSKTQHP